MEERRKVLLADDVELFLELEKSFLKRADIDLLVARDGQQALDLTRLHRPNVVFLDLYMPVLEGDDCCRSIKGYPELSDVKVIMVTTAGKPEEMQRCRDAGCDEILLKPINRSEFMGLARKYLQIEVRSDARLKAEVRVFYGPTPQKMLENFSVDLSTGGLFVHSAAPLDVNEEMTLRFTLPDKSGNVSCKARVAWVNDAERPRKPALPTGMGVQFVDLSLDDMHTIRRFLEHNELEPSW
jgi:uncharacterized protein (TIGR02266 family)